MREYVLRYVQEIDEESVELFWRCQADDYQHAIEQLTDSEDRPDTIISIEEV